MIENVLPAATAQLAPQRNYPLNCWWVAATSEEVGSKPLGRWLLDRPVVLYRTEAGNVTALDDRCVHRWAPLSSGFLEGDTLVCGYHGARYSADGRCIRYPTQSSIPATACVRSYSVIERGPFIWIWMGDDAKASQASLPPDFAWSKDPARSVVRGGYMLDANYLLLHENVLDLTHFNYLHRNSFGITNRNAPDYRVEGNQVISSRVVDCTGYSRSELAAARLDTMTIRVEETGRFVTPALHSLESVAFRRPNPQLPEREVTYINHCVTPENPSRTHYWWFMGFGAMPPEAASGLSQFIANGFSEDKMMLESIQRLIDCDARHRDFPEFSFVGDAGGIQARRALQRILVDDER
jgi:phenylpropionate dioxygenase-like ring-hydroxylating dioxygenase large terminal subunit